MNRCFAALYFGSRWAMCSWYRNLLSIAVEDNRPLCQLSSKRLEEKWYNWYITALRCFVEDNRPLCQLSSKRLEEKWYNCR